MRAVVFTETGESDVLQVVDREPTEPGAGEVRIRVVRSGVNPTDWKVRKGATGAGMAFPEIVPNQDGAGVVDAVGQGVLRLHEGDRVWTMLAAHERPTGTAQELVVLPEERVFPLPDEASYDLGASLGVPAVTAHRALTTSEDGPPRLGPSTLAGTTVLVQGGAGAVGNAAIQLGVWAGATVIATVSSDAKAELARAAGAHHVVDYTAGDTAATIRDLAPDGVHIVVEVAPAQNLELDLTVLAPRGTIAIYANNGGDEVPISVRRTFSTNVRMQFVYLYLVGSEALANAAEDVTAAVREGGLDVGQERGLALHHFPLDETAAAHKAVEDGVVGKVLVDVSDPV
jgi:NADPH2:quinone reductase